MTIELIGGKVLLCQIQIKLMPGANAELAIQEFMHRLQIPAAFAKGAEIAVGVVDHAPPGLPRT